MATQRAPLSNVPETNREPAERSPHSERRAFLAIFLGAATSAFAALGSLPFARYILYPLYASAPEGSWIDIGALEDFGAREPTRKLVNIEHLDGWQKTTSQEAIYVTRDSAGSLAVLSAVCPHLGCSVAWHSSSATFVCPCHGGCFAANGSRISGPPPRNLSSLPVKTDGGRLAIRYESRPA